MQDGDDNTVAASYWSCQAPTGTLSSSFGYESSFDYESCWLYFELNDEYTASYMMLCTCVAHTECATAAFPWLSTTVGSVWS